MQQKVKNNTKQNYIICAGGTGGHIFPCLNLARRLLTIANTNSITFLTDNRFTQKYREKYFDVFENKAFKIITLPVISTSNLKSPIGAFRFIYFMFLSLFKSLKICFMLKPSSIVAFGGYICFPILAAGVVLKKTIILQEQNSVIGRVNAIFLPFCKQIYTSFSAVEGIKPKYKNKQESCNILLSDKFNALLSNDKPLKNNYPTLQLAIEGIKLPKQLQSNYPSLKNQSSLVITIMGGSLGSTALSTKIANVITQIISQTQTPKTITINHQVRKNDIQQVKQIYTQNSKIYQFNIEEFFTNPEEMLFNTDIFISRAGASSVFEGLYCGAYCIFIPIKAAIKNHQYKNALLTQQTKPNKIMIVDEAEYPTKIQEALKSFIYTLNK